MQLIQCSKVECLTIEPCRSKKCAYKTYGLNMVPSSYIYPGMLCRYHALYNTNICLTQIDRPTDRHRYTSTRQTRTTRLHSLPLSNLLTQIGTDKDAHIIHTHKTLTQRTQPTRTHSHSPVPLHPRPRPRSIQAESDIPYTRGSIGWHA